MSADDDFEDSDQRLRSRSPRRGDHGREIRYYPNGRSPRPAPAPDDHGDDDNDEPQLSAERKQALRRPRRLAEAEAIIAMFDEVGSMLDEIDEKEEAIGKYRIAQGGRGGEPLYGKEKAKRLHLISEWRRLLGEFRMRALHMPPP